MKKKHFLAVNVICGIEKILDIIIHKSVEVNLRAFDPRRLFFVRHKNTNRTQESGGHGQTKANCSRSYFLPGK